MTKRRVEIDVEPLSERRWAAIEERVLERVDAGDPVSEVAPSRRRAAGIAATAAVAAAAIAVAWWSWGTPAEPSLATSRIVTAGDVAQTSAGDVAIEVAPRSSVLVLERARDAWLVSIEHGAASFRVPPRAGRPAFVVEGGLMRVEVVGTAFTVSREAGAASARVVVDEGTVRVTAAGAVTLVHAGEQWPAEPTPQVDTSASTRSTPQPSVEVPAMESGGEAEPAARGVARAPRRSDGPAERGAAEPHEAHTPEAEDEREAHTAPTARERFVRAEALERTAPEAALREYAALAREGGAWGANALFAQGRLELELTHHDRARVLLERYLARHPQGLNAEDARVLLDRIR